MFTKYAAAKPNVGISGGNSAQTGHTCTWSTQLLAKKTGFDRFSHPHFSVFRF